MVQEVWVRRSSGGYTPLTPPMHMYAYGYILKQPSTALLPISIILIVEQVKLMKTRSVEMKTRLEMCTSFCLFI